MRSFDSRADTVVCDEPLYAHYLQFTGLSHPGAEEIINTHDSDWRRVIEKLISGSTGDALVFYQKHMAHHLLPHIDRGWLDHVTHIFLIREPRAMLNSLLRVTPGAGIDDTGLPQQANLFHLAWERTGSPPPVVDARDILENPEAILRALCLAIDIPFDDKMLSWSPGPRPTDGCWAPHWYRRVYESSGFAPYQPPDVLIPSDKIHLLELCQCLYEKMSPYRLQPGE
jgi:hypothetical protein